MHGQPVLTLRIPPVQNSFFLPDIINILKSKQLILHIPSFQMFLISAIVIVVLSFSQCITLLWRESILNLFGRAGDVK